MTQYNDLDQALPGLIYGTSPRNVDTGLAVEAITFGAPVFVLEGDDSGVYAAAGANRRLKGVAIRTTVEAASQNGTFAAPGNGTAQYNVKDAVNVLTEGKCWVPVPDAVVAHRPVYLTPAGAWTDEVSGNTITPYFFRSSTTAAGLAVVELG